MISYDDLCDALSRFQAKKQGGGAGLDFSNENTGPGEALEVLDDQRSPELDAGDIVSDEPGSN